MATQIEILRQKAEEATGAFSAEMAKYHDDNLPNGEQAAHIDTLRNAMTAAIKDRQAAESVLKSKSDWEAQSAQFASSGRNDVRSKGDDMSGDRRSLGQRFVENPSYREWLAMVAPNGAIPENTKGISSPPMKFAGLREIDRMAALITGDSSTSAGAFVRPQYYPELVRLGGPELTMRQVITNLQTDTDTIEYVRETTRTNNAAPVAEATASSGSTGVKPESGLAYEQVTANVKTIAHWIPATKQAVSDASQIRGLIDEFLRTGLDEELESQIVNGSGTGQNFTGILNTSGRQSQAWDQDILRTMRIAKLKVRTVGRRQPNAFILNPVDWANIELLRDNVNRFYANGPFSSIPNSVWSLPVVESEEVPEGKGLVGDFRQCVLWDREQSSIAVSDSHADFFIRNMVAILAELRAAFGILKPNALVEIDLTA